MSSEPSSGRLLAPLALIAVTLIVIVIVAGSLGGSDPEPIVSDRVETTSTTTQRERTTGRQGGDLPQKTYVVKPGDNFEAISSKTGIPTDELLELNPDLDPQALISGQKVRLR